MITFIIKSEEIFDFAQRHLGIIAKRATDGNGDTDFNHFMLQTNESEIVDMYVKEAINRICSFCPERVHRSNSIAPGEYVFYIDGGRDRNYIVESSELSETNEGSDKELIANTALSFILNHVLAQYLSAAETKYAEKYIAESTRTLTDLRNIIYIKEPPSSVNSLSQTTGSCS